MAVTKTTKGKGKGKIRLALVAVALFAAFLLLPEDSALKQAATWRRQTSPGPLSRAHANLEGDCGACHTPVSGVDDTKCVLCHASNLAILQRQPTAFHANIGDCKECHREHLGVGRRPTEMDHEAISRIGLRVLEDQTEPPERGLLREYLRGWASDGAALGPGARVSRLEAVLACDSCHANEDRHFALFGSDCGECHATDMWTLPEFRHPSPQSRDCAQCHQAPPSHYMGHFKMISATVARKPLARVSQCFECHRTTSWTDIPGTGRYKHH